VRAARERLDIQRLRILPVDPVADPAQPREVAQCCASADLLATYAAYPSGTL